MTTASEKNVAAQTAMGSHIIQVSGDLSVTNIVMQQPLEQMPAVVKLSRQERAQLAAWAEEVVAAEQGNVSTKVVRGALNAYLGVKSVDEMTPDMVQRAGVFLNGWRNCASGRELSTDAMVAQVLRIWTTVPHVKTATIEFARANFNREVLRTMTAWELRSTLAYAMVKWQAYWEARNA
ncbi:hypothetical protein [Burkholderia multivorans]|uniref:hypothetical protein n=1 Tax=Burkholderia multivorans TaxID=87883 RepID=UPI0019D1ECA6|nr:hypothetical protein [Burkholderia multivorans]MBN6732752.1 hypothetical protein [Burkholderia multivorans]MBN8167057.1 hypothetical protein [Burkholderia multivorans]MBN8172850.1 hypothetical protein [Burkholderia multivorans]MBN8178467.1 hypothetical protein [Burkholderia multivorans]MCA8478228.1 hypothetical protein [Burkholderia multivorans]